MSISFGPAIIIDEYEGEATQTPFYLAKETIWEGDLCRGGEFDAAIFDAKYRDDNGTVIVAVDDGDTACKTIELLTEDKFISSYVGARLNFHYYKRPQ
ncbi:MAG: hypothetical protein HQ513_15740 [Rhodospirillales bacterium]|nr:hypothetical protein [Rhodospirillales bacterium]